MRDIAVHMGPNGLGLQLNMLRGGVVVCGHTPMPVGAGNPGKVSTFAVGIWSLKARDGGGVVMDLGLDY